MTTAGKVLFLATGEGQNAVFLAGFGMEDTDVGASDVGLTSFRRISKRFATVV